MERRSGIASLAITILVAACAGAGQSSSGPPPAASSAAPAGPEASPRATGSPAPESTPSVSPSGLTIVYEENAQFELVTPAGRHVLIDVPETDRLLRPPTPDDVLLTTHAHADHLLVRFEASFPGPKLTAREGRISLPDVTIVGLSAPHNEGDPFRPRGGTNYLFVIEVDGLRIVHLGDCGQARLTASQLTAIGRADIVLAQLSNPYSRMNAANHKGLDLVRQLAPRIFIPTAHVDRPTLEQAAAAWPMTWLSRPRLSVAAATLPDEPITLVAGGKAAAWGQLLDLPRDAYPG